jgi:hypothetical protein
MAGYFEANGIQFAPITEGVRPDQLFTGRYHDVGQWGPAPFATKPIYDDRAKTFPAIDGITDVRHGFRGRGIFATLIFAGALDAVDASCKSTLDSLSQNARYTIQLPGGSSFDGCKLADVGQESYVNCSGGVLLIVPAIFIQKSLTN